MRATGPPGHDEERKGLFKDKCEELRPKLYARAFRKTGSREAADDLVQETFVRTWKHRDRFNSAVGLSSWLFVVLDNLIVDRWRREQIDREALSYDDPQLAEIKDEADLSVESQVAHSQFWCLVEKCLKGKKEFSLVLKLEYLYDLSDAEIAPILSDAIGKNIPVISVRRIRFDARKALKDHPEFKESYGETPRKQMRQIVEAARTYQR